MESPLRWYEWDTRFIAAHHQLFFFFKQKTAYEMLM